jgi:hypothetical protein
MTLPGVDAERRDIVNRDNRSFASDGERRGCRCVS